MAGNPKKHNAIALLCVAGGQPYAAAAFVFVSIVYLFGSRASGDR